MTTNQENKLNMYHTVERYLLANASAVRTLPNYKPSFAALQACIQKINVTKQTQEVNQSGVAEQKQQRREAIVGLAVDLINKLKAYAMFTSQTILLREIDFSASDLRQASASVLTDRARIIMNRAQEHTAALAEYRVQPDQITALQAAINAFVTTIPDTRLGTMTRKNSTDTLKSCFAEADVVLKEKLDVIAGIVQGSHPDFYAGYLDARAIMDRKARSTTKKADIAA